VKAFNLRARFKRPGPWLQMTMALVGLCGTLVLLADLFFGVMPDREHQKQRLHQQLAESMAVQVAVLLQQDDAALLQRALNAMAEQTPGLRSLGVRRAQGELLARAGPHEKLWQPDATAHAAPEQISVPLQAAAGPWGRVEVAFARDQRPMLLALVQQPLMTTLLFVSFAGTVVFGLYLRRVLQHLDPSSAIPERVQNAFDVMAEGVAVLDDRGRVLLVNKSFRKLHPLAAQVKAGVSLSAQPWLAESLGADEREHPWVRTVADGTSIADLPLVVAAGSSAERRLTVNCTPITDAGGATRGCMATFDDVSDLHRSNEALRGAMQALNQSNEKVQRQNLELERLATRDPMTGCLNRRALLAAFEAALADADRSGRPVSCLMLDIDHFKSVNDRFGHGIGDRVIQEVAKRMQACARSTDLVGRYGGEEFCILMPGLGTVQAAEVAERIRESIERECAAAVHEVTGLRVTASLGVEAYGPAAATPALMMDRADQALYRAKRGGRNQVRIYADGLDGAAEDAAAVPDKPVAVAQP
jgi:diguanylate cyclase (GGDEF)-like protein